MRIVGQIYDFSHRVLKDNHTFIFLFQASYKKKDYFCRRMNMTNTYMLIPHKDIEAIPQSMFLHDLGQYVNIALTCNHKVVPEDFALVTSLICLNQDDCDVSEFLSTASQ